MAHLSVFMHSTPTRDEQHTFLFIIDRTDLGRSFSPQSQNQNRFGENKIFAMRVEDEEEIYRNRVIITHRDQCQKDICTLPTPFPATDAAVKTND